MGRHPAFQLIRQVCQGTALTSRTQRSGNRIKIKIQIMRGTECERRHRARSQRAGEERGEALKALKQEGMGFNPPCRMIASTPAWGRGAALLSEASTGGTADSLRVLLGSKSLVETKQYSSLRGMSACSKLTCGKQIGTLIFFQKSSEASWRLLKERCQPSLKHPGDPNFGVLDLVKESARVGESCLGIGLWEVSELSGDTQKPERSRTPRKTGLSTSIGHS